MSGDHNEDARRPQELRRAASIGSRQHPPRELKHTPKVEGGFLQSMIIADRLHATFKPSNMYMKTSTSLVCEAPTHYNVASHHFRLYAYIFEPSTSSDTDHGRYAPRTPELCGSDSTSHLHDAFEKKAQEGHRFTLRLRARTPRLRPVVFYSRHHRAHQREMRLCMRTTMP